GALKDLHVDPAFGAVFQTGVDVPIDGHWGLYADAKLALLSLDVTGTLNGAPTTANLPLNPIIVTLGGSNRLSSAPGALRPPARDAPAAGLGDAPQLAARIDRHGVTHALQHRPVVQAVAEGVAVRERHAVALGNLLHDGGLVLLMIDGADDPAGADAVDGLELAAVIVRRAE